MQKRVGRFTISHKMIYLKPEAAKKVLSETIVVRAESLFYTERIEYLAYSEHFDKVSPNQMPPEYDVEVTEEFNGEEVEYEVKFIRR